MLNIHIRSITLDDTDKIVKWRNKNFVMNNFIFRELFTKELHINWMQEKVSKGTVLQYIIEVDNISVGSVFLKDINHEDKKAEFGIFIGEEQYLNKGIGTIATSMILEKAFNEFSLHKVYLRVLSENKRAYASYIKSGFVQEANLKDEIKIDGVYHDLILMAQFSKES